MKPTRICLEHRQPPFPPIIILFILALTIMSLLPATTIHAAGVIYVKANATGNNNGSSWTHAYTDLQTALASAVNGGHDQVWVAAGSYTPTTGTDRGAVFMLQNGVAIYGGFAGTETMLSERNISANLTVLSGDIDHNDSQTPVITDLSTVTGNATNSYHIIGDVATDSSAILDGFTISGGNANGEAWPDNSGGGVFSYLSGAMVRNVTFSGNSATGGGGMYADSSTLTLSNVTFSGNSASLGGGMSVYSSTLTLNNMTFSSNNAQYGGAILNRNSNPMLNTVTFSSNRASVSGGGMYNNASNPMLTDITFSDNSATSNGGAMVNATSSPTLTNVMFSNNRAVNGSGGGMVNMSTSNPTLSNVTFNGNSASVSGGGMDNNASSPSVRTVTFSGNSAPSGGGMYNRVSHPDVTDITFATNSASSGGGMYNYGSNPTLTNVTFSDNSVSVIGGGMHNYGSNPTLTNVTFSGNSARFNGGGMSNDASSPTLTSITFSGNSADYSGGGMYNDNDTSDPTQSSSPTLITVTFEINSAYWGGGMDNEKASNPVLTNVTFRGNTATSSGGGMYNASSSPKLTKVTFRGNTATSSGGGMYNETSNPALITVIFEANSATYGGGMSNEARSDPTLTKVTFSGNGADNSGGGMFNYETSNPIVTNSMFSDNSAMYGGGMLNASSNPFLGNVTFSGNSATGGGGMYNSASSPTVNNGIFSGNKVLNRGGGMYNLDSNPVMSNATFSGNNATTSGGGMLNNGASNPQIANSILWGNSNTIFNTNGATTTITASVVEGSGSSRAWDGTLGSDGGGNLDVDPQFVLPLAWTTAPTTTSDLHLQSSSPALNAGNNTLLPLDTADLNGNGNTTEPLPLDLDGNPRIIGGTVDMGAYEMQYPCVISIVRADANPTNQATVAFTVTFDRAVTGVDTADFHVTTTGDQSGASIGTVSGGPTIWSITVNTVNLVTGTIRLDLVDDDSIITSAIPPVPLGMTGVGNGNFSSGEVYDIDRVAPTVSLSTSVADPTNSSSFTVTVTFSEDMTNFTQDDLSVTNATVSAFAGSGAVYSFTLTPSANGLVTVDVAAGVAPDVVGNGNSAAAQLRRTYDTIAPTVSLNTPAMITTTNAASYSVNGSCTTDDDAVIVQVGSVSGSTPCSSGSFSTTLDVSSLADGNGIAVKASQTDRAGNLGSASATSIKDVTVPTVSLSTMVADPTNSSSFTVTVTFSEDMTNFTQDDLSVTNATVSAFAGSGAVYSFTLTPSANGLVTVDVAAGVATDVVGNGNTAAAQLRRTYDSGTPVAPILPSPTVPVSGAATYTFTVVFSDAPDIDPTSLGDGDIRVRGPGGFDQAATLVGVYTSTNTISHDQTASLIGVQSPLRATYAIVPPGGSWDGLDNGSYSIELVAGAIRDTAGNVMAAANLGSFQVTLRLCVYLPQIKR